MPGQAFRVHDMLSWRGHTWMIIGIYHGATGEASVVEIEPMQQRPSSQGRMLVPMAICRALTHWRKVSNAEN